MGLFTSIDKDAKSFASKFEIVYTKLFQEEPAIEAAVVASISKAAPIVLAIVAATGQEAEAPAILAVIGAVKNDLAVLQTTLNDAGAGTSNATIKSTLSAIMSNLGSLLSAGMIKNATTLASVTSEVSKLSDLFNILIATV